MIKTIWLLAMAAALYGGVVGGVAVLVKGEPITLHEVKAAMKEHSLAADKAAEMLTRQKLEEIEARERGISVDSQEVFEEVRRIAQQNGLTVMQFYDAIERSQGLSETMLKEKIRAQLTNRKLYNKIAFSQIEQPTPEEEAEYYQIHKAEFSQPVSVTALAYHSASKERLEQKAANPMLYAPDIRSESVTLTLAQLDPRIAALLAQTPTHTFTPVLPETGGFVSYYVQGHGEVDVQTLDEVREEIRQRIMTQKRQQVLNDYFTRLQLTADIETLRLP